MSKLVNKFLAQSATLTLKGNNTGGTANISDLTVSQVNTMLGDILANGTVPFSADQSMGSHKLTNVTDPVGAQDAATKNYVDAGLAGLNPATSVYAATAGSNIPGTYFNGVGGVGATFTTTATGTFTVDGTTPPLNARILIKDQSSGFQNGIYTITTLGIVGVQTVFTRALDYDTPSDINSAGLIPVINGTVNALSSWQQIATITTVGTDALVFTEFTANPSLYLLKANNLNDVASKSISFNNLSPMTTLGDVIYGGTSGSGTRLAGNTTSTKNFLVQTGTGSVSAAPSWGTIVAADVPTLNQNTTGTASNVTGVVAVVNGGTGQSSYTDGQLLIGNSSGNTLTKTSLTAGSNITITPGSGSITIAASSSANPAFNFTSQSTTYAATISDYILASGASFVITLPTAASQSGKQIVIQHNGTSLSQKYTLNTTSAQTINGPGGSVASGVYKLTTNGEKLVLTSDGSNWQVTEHDTNTGWVSAGNAVYYETFTVSSANATIGATYTNNGATFTVAKTIAAGTTLITQFFSGGPLTSGTLTKASGTGDATITFSAVSGNISPITGTTINPVYYGSPVTNTFAWKRVGNMMTLLIQFYQDTAGAVAGSGDFIYDFSVPIPNVQIDTTYFPTFTGGTANTFQGETPATMINMQPFANGSHSHASAYSQINGFIPFAATQFRVYGTDVTTTTNGFPWGSTLAPGNVIQSMNYQISFPVSDWQP